MRSPDSAQAKPCTAFKDAALPFLTSQITVERTRSQLQQTSSDRDKAAALSSTLMSKLEQVGDMLRDVKRENQSLH